MKNTIKVLAIIALVAVIGFSFVACDDGTDTDDNPGIGGTYFFASDSETYVLVISDDGTYVLTVLPAVGEGKTSTGTAKKDGGVYKLTPSSSEEEGDADPFTVTVNSTGVTGMTGTITFEDGTSEEAPGEVEVAPPESVPDEYRWWAWQDPSSTATLVNFSVEDDTATITTGGRPEPQGPNVWQAWKITAGYDYTSKENASYVYVIEAWKAEGSGDRSVNVQYYEDTGANIYLSESITLTNTPTEYTIYGQKLPKRGEPVRFQCADYIGTFHLKIISIEEYGGAGELTITNFRGTPGLRSDKWTMGDAHFSIDDEWVTVVFMQVANGFNIPATGDSITVPVYNAVFVEGEGYQKTTPFTGTVTVAAGVFSIDQWGGNTPDLFYTNKEPITFTNGKATINFGTQMMKEEDFDWDNVTPDTGGSGYSLNGTWLEESGTIMTVAGNTVTITLAEGELFGHGTFTINGNKMITVSFTDGEMEGETFDGTFSLSDNGHTLAMTIGGENAVWTENTYWTRQP